jgi:eIF-2B alpha/beta/delta-like uncharacterized protein
MSIEPYIQDKITSIKDDTTHGASELARQALDTLQLAASESNTDDPDQFLSEFDEISNRLVSVHPAMAPIYNMVKRLQAGLADYKNSDAAILKKAAINLADELIRSSVNAAAKIAGYATELVSKKETIMTHSYSSTAAAALKKAFNTQGIQVIVTRSGVSRVGQRAAWELSYVGMRITYIDDTAIGLYIPLASKVMVGADRICSDGGVVNGIGTYLMALAAEKAGVPVYVLCENAKFDPRMNSSEIEHEEKNPLELAAPGILPEGVEVKNPYYDLTPLKYITGIITEEGLVNQRDVPAYVEKLAAQLR